MNFTQRLPLLQNQLQTAQLDGYLLYDFRGSNPLAGEVLGLPPDAHLTRRWFCFVPAQHGATPTVLCSAIEAGTWRNLLAQIAPAGDVSLHVCVGWAGLEAGLKLLLRPGLRVAMEYSPRGAVPYVGKVDAGVVEWVRDLGAQVVSSGELLLPFLQWTREDLAAHRRACDGLMAAKTAAFALIHDRLRAGLPVDELTVQAHVGRVLTERGLVFDHPAIVAFGGHGADPHYAPHPEGNATLQPGQCILIDLWAQEAKRPFADVTWMGCAGEPSPKLTHVWQAVRDARDVGIAFLQKNFPGAQGWQADRTARDLLAERGFGDDAFIHRLGHDIGRTPGALHGPGVHLDDFETHDTRRLATGLAVSVEPGVYLPVEEVGVRSEVNVYFHADRAEVTTPIQRDLYVLGTGDFDAVHRRATSEG
jgi:Xaa-Pro aminopeptidase